MVCTIITSCSTIIYDLLCNKFNLALVSATSFLFLSSQLYLMIAAIAKEHQILILLNFVCANRYLTICRS